MSNVSSNFEMTGAVLGQDLPKRKTPQETIVIWNLA